MLMKNCIRIVKHGKEGYKLIISSHGELIKGKTRENER